MNSLFIVEDISNYLSTLSILMVLITIVAGFLAEWQKIKRIYFRIISVLFIFIILSGMAVHMYYAFKVKKQFKNDLAECRVVSINDIMLDANASMEVYGVLKKIRIHDIDRRSRTLYGYELDLVCKDKDIKIMIEKTHEKDIYYSAYTYSYSQKGCVRLGPLNTKSLLKYHDKKILDCTGFVY